MASARGIRAGRAYVEVGVRDKLARGLRAAQAKLRAFAAGVKAIGQQMVRASAAVAVPFAVSTIVFARFEKSMARVKALTGATGESFRKLRTEAERLGETTVFTASQAAEAMGFFALAGFNVKQILEAIGPALNLAAAGQLEIAESADIVAKVMKGMGLETGETGRAVDVLTKAMTTANTDLTQLGGAMKFIGPIAKAAGIEFEEVVAAIQLLSNAGMQGEMAGTILRGALLKLTAPSAEAEQQLKQLGVSAADATGNVRPLAEIIGDLQRAMQGRGTAEQLKILGTIFGARPAAGMAELLSQGGDKLREYTQALRESGGTAAEVADVQLNTLAGDATLFKSALEGVAIAIGDTFGGLVRIGVRALTRAVGALSAWVKGNREVVLLAGLSVVAVGAFGVTLVALGVAAQVASFVLGGLVSILIGIKVVLLALVSPAGLAVAAVVGLGVAIAKWTGVGGVALGWLRKQFGKLRDFVGKVAGGIQDALAGGDISLAGQVLWASLRVVWEKGVLELMRAFNTLETAWVETVIAMEKFWVTFQSNLKKGWAVTGYWLKSAWSDLRGLWDEFIGGMTMDEAHMANVERKLEIGFAMLGDLARIAADEKKALAEAEGRHTAAKEAEIWEAEIALIQAQNALTWSLHAAKQAAKQAAEQAAQEGEDGAPPSYKPGWWGTLADALESVDDKVAQRIQVAGTFNPLAARGLTGKRAADRTAKATEQTARNTKQILDAVRDNPLVYGP